MSYLRAIVHKNNFFLFLFLEAGFHITQADLQVAMGDGMAMTRDDLELLILCPLML